MKYYLDTNICIYYMKGMYSNIKEKLLSKHPDDVKIASIVKAELIYGAEKSKLRASNREKINNFLLPFQIKAFGNQESEEYGQLRSTLEKAGKGIGPNDLILAATVLANDGTIITNNEKEFRRIKNLKIDNWTK